MNAQPCMTPTDFHVLLVLSQGSLYGYAIMKAIDEESDGSITPEIGSLYRVLARLVSQGFVEQVDSGPVEDEQVHPGRQRKYYALSPAGERALRGEAARLGGALDIARSRGLLPARRS
ncbi:MAG: PadR family transcriptional regulator [Gemmatimonadota bacterium]|nr:PadR family transcriptional regulator [Gemmatimonadota bacterium]